MNGLDAVNILFQNLKPILFDIAAPTGRLYRGQRPLNSNKEDIIIGNLTMGREDGVQTGILNVNIHVPNITISSGGITDRSIPDNDRLNELLQIVETFFPVYTDTYNYEIDSDDMFEESESSYVNLRVEFRSINVDEH